MAARAQSVNRVQTAIAGSASRRHATGRRPRLWRVCAALATVVAGADYAAAAMYEIPEPGIDLVGRVAQIRASHEDTFVSLAQTHGVGYEELVAANPAVDPWLPGADTAIIIPSSFVLPDVPRDGIVLNLAEMRLYHYATTAGSLTVQTYPISVGHLDTDTPTVDTRIVDKVRDPTWYPPRSIIAEHAARGEVLPAIVPPGPDNPLGRFAMQLGIPGYLIHSTNRPAGIGMRVTHGCIRMLPSDISELFEQVPRGTPVRIINSPYKMGWHGDTLYLEVHRPFEDDTRFTDRGMTAITELYVKHTQDVRTDVDWNLVETVFSEAKGIPVSINGPGPERKHQRLATWCSGNPALEICAAG